MQHSFIIYNFRRQKEIYISYQKKATFLFMNITYLYISRIPLKEKVLVETFKRGLYAKYCTLITKRSSKIDQALNLRVSNKLA